MEMGAARIISFSYIHVPSREKTQRTPSSPEVFEEVIKQRLQDEKVEKLSENVIQIVFITSSNLIGVCV